MTNLEYLRTLSAESLSDWLYNSWLSKQAKCYTNSHNGLIEWLKKDSNMIGNTEAIRQLQAALTAMARCNGKSVNDFYFALGLAIKSLEAWDKLPDNICNLLVDTGQRDFNKFKLGETIKYTPSETMNIIRENLDKLQRGDYE